MRVLDMPHYAMKVFECEERDDEQASLCMNMKDSPSTRKKRAYRFSGGLHQKPGSHKYQQVASRTKNTRERGG